MPRAARHLPALSEPRPATARLSLGTGQRGARPRTIPGRGEAARGGWMKRLRLSPALSINPVGG